MTLHRPQTISRGFTLVELLVAMTITTIIVSVLVSITSLAMDTWNRSRSELRAARQAKTMVDSMANDFEALVTRRGNTNEWLSAVVNPADLAALGPADLKSTNACKLVFFTAATDRYNGDIGVTGKDLGGDVSCVGYQLSYQNPISGVLDSGTQNNFNSFVLYRLLVNPNDTFTKLLGKVGVPNSSDASDTRKPLDSVFTTAYPTAQPPTNANLNAPKNFVSENICQFSLTFHVQVTDTSSSPAVLSDVPVTMGGTVTKFRILGSQIDTDYVPTSSTITTAMVAAGRVTAIELSVSVVSDYGLDQLKKPSLNPDTITKIKAQSIYQYSKRVQVPGM